MKPHGVSILLILLISSSLNFAEKVRYDNHKVYSIQIENEEQLEMMREMEEISVGYHVLRHPTKVHKNVLVLVSPEMCESFTKITEDMKLSVTVLHKNYQELIDQELTKEVRDGEIDWTSYHTLEVINAWLDKLVSEHSDIVSSVIGGSSHEGRQIKGIYIKFNENNPNLVIESNIHAREWITSATATWIINYLLTEQELGVLAEYNWYIFPVINPDGFSYTHSHDRLWRKTRKRSILCYGADPNRNFDHSFNVVGTSKNPCSNTYAGAFAFSEIETKSFGDFLKTVPKLEVYLDFHSSGQMLMFPYGNTTDHLGNYQEHYDIAGKAVKKLEERHGTNYTFGNVAETIYLAAGISIDWVKDAINPRLSYTYELRDRGEFGHELPPDQIIPTAEETLDSIIVILTEAQKLN